MSGKRKTRILVFVGHYLPGFKSGGILRSVLNSIDYLSDEFEFLVVTRNIDVGESEPYKTVVTGQWVSVGKAKVYYLDYNLPTLSKIRKIIDETEYDAVHLNSFFDPISIKANLIFKFKFRYGIPIILSPRGEFADASFGQKKLKKQIFVKVSKLLNLYSRVVWHVSSKYEKVDLVSKMGVNEVRVREALDLPETHKKESDTRPPELSNENLRVVFLSRISKEKNLDIAISILSSVQSNVVFHIYGTIEDCDYWNDCQKMMDSLPSNVQIKYCGEVIHNNVISTFSKYDLFLFPTGGENYGHVIVEAISAGTKVLISKNTPWLDMENKGLGWDFHIEDKHSFINVIEKMAKIDVHRRTKERAEVVKIARSILENPSVISGNRALYDQE